MSTNHTVFLWSTIAEAQSLLHNHSRPNDPHLVSGTQQSPSLIGCQLCASPHINSAPLVARHEPQSALFSPALWRGSNEILHSMARALVASLSYAMLFHAIPCYAMLCMLCYAMANCALLYSPPADVAMLDSEGRPYLGAGADSIWCGAAVSWSQAAEDTWSMALRGRKRVGDTGSRGVGGGGWLVGDGGGWCNGRLNQAAAI